MPIARPVGSVAVTVVSPVVGACSSGGGAGRVGSVRGTEAVVPDAGEGVAAPSTRTWSRRKGLPTNATMATYTQRCATELTKRSMRAHIGLAIGSIQ